MWLLPLMVSGLAALTKRPVVHGSLLGLIPPTIAFAMVKVRRIIGSSRSEGALTSSNVPCGLSQLRRSPCLLH